MKHADIISKMTLREKATFLTGKDFWQSKDFPKLNIPSMFLSDGPHGIRKQAAAADHLGLNESIKATCFPTAATMANSWNDILGEEMGEALGIECASQDVNVLLGPGTNIKRNPRCGRNFEYFSEDPYLAGKMAASYIRGIQKNGTASCVKHFCANNQEERRMVTDSIIDERTLREIYLTQFEIAVKEGKPKTIMSSYNKLNGTFTNENEHLLREILRKEWRFDGVVVTDWAGCNSRPLGVKAGNELEMPSCLYGIQDIIDAVESGELDIKYVDECVDRLLTLVFDTTKKGRKGEDGFDIDAHHNLAEKCAEESIVLLKNDGVLPLKKQKVCVVGDFANKPRYQGAGSSVVNPTKLDNFLSVVDNESFEYVGYAQGFDRYGKKNKSLLNKAKKLAQNSDTILLFLGLDEVTEAEGLDRENIKIPSNQIELFNALDELNKKIVIVLSCGSAVELENLKGANAILYNCLNGQAGAMATYNILIGKVNPSGKLAETFPISYEDTPTSKYFPGKILVEYREGPFIGYRYYDTTKKAVSFPFGYGLSYTTFEYSNLKVDNYGVMFTIKNTGAYDGKEIAELYIGKKESEIFRPIKELKGFKKVFIKKGTSVDVTIPFDDKSFRYFNVKTNKWEIEGGEYQIYVGASVDDIRLTGVIYKEGTTTVIPYDKETLKPYYTGEITNLTREDFLPLYGKELGEDNYPFYKKNRIVIHENCTIQDLRYSRGWVGRFFSWCIRAGIGIFKFFGNRTMANTLVMGMLHQPIRGMAKFASMSRRQMEGLMTMFNGKFFKGLGMFLSKDKKPKTK